MQRHSDFKRACTGDKDSPIYNIQDTSFTFKLITYILLESNSFRHAHWSFIGGVAFALKQPGTNAFVAPSFTFLHTSLLSEHSQKNHLVASCWRAFSAAEKDKVMGAWLFRSATSRETSLW